MKITIRDRDDFINSFLTPLSRIADSAVLKVSEEAISVIITNADNTLAVYSQNKNVSCSGNKNLNIPDLKKLCRVLSCIDEKECTLDISGNNINFESDSVRFKYHLYEDNIIKTPKQISFDKLKEMPFDGNFTITQPVINSLIKGSTIATDTNKLYLSVKGNSVYGELTDKTRANTDSYGIKISENYKGEQTATSLPLNFELFRIISSTKFKDISVRMASKRGLLIFSTQTETTDIKFIVSAIKG